MLRKLCHKPQSIYCFTHESQEQIKQNLPFLHRENLFFPSPMKTVVLIKMSKTKKVMLWLSGVTLFRFRPNIIQLQKSKGIRSHI